MQIQFYKNRFEEISNKIKKQKKVLRQLSLIRLLFFIAGFIMLFSFSNLNLWPAVTIFLIVFSAFLYFVVKYLKLEKHIVDNEYMLKLLANEVQTYSNKSNLFGDGAEFSDYTHPYTGDLDIFGKFSIFNRINRTVTYEGKEILAGLLKNPDKDREFIISKQDAVKELSEKSEFRDKFLLNFFTSSLLNEENRGIQKWIDNFPKILDTHKFLRYGLMIFSVILLVVSVLSLIYDGIFPYLIVLVLISFVVNIRFKRKVDVLHNHASKQSELFIKYADLMDIIVEEDFDEILLNKIRDAVNGKDKFRSELLKIAGIIRKLDYRLNIFVGPILNLFFFWDIHQSIDLETWILRNQNKFGDWLNNIGSFDALLTLSIVRFNNPDWIFPLVTDKKEVYFKGNGLAHPLINDCIKNDYYISGNSRFDIVTGSNMAGKSTFLRTVGVNWILAMAGSPVKAESVEFTPANIFTYMRISDSIELELSTFHAELERIKSILKYVEHNEKCFLLLDELLRGTNTIDRQTGSIALLKQLVRNGASGIIATHDLNLPEMEKMMPENIRNYNFSIQSKDEDLFFDYKLNHGVCKTFNAALLMKKIGIEVGEEEIKNVKLKM